MTKFERSLTIAWLIIMVILVFTVVLPFMEAAG